VQKIFPLNGAPTKRVEGKKLQQSFARARVVSTDGSGQFKFGEVSAFKEDGTNKRTIEIGGIWMIEWDNDSTTEQVNRDKLFECYDQYPEAI
jgi:hypothetical protein